MTPTTAAPCTPVVVIAAGCSALVVVAAPLGPRVAKISRARIDAECGVGAVGERGDGRSSRPAREVGWGRGQCERGAEHRGLLGRQGGHAVADQVRHPGRAPFGRRQLLIHGGSECRTAARQVRASVRGSCCRLFFSQAATGSAAAGIAPVINIPAAATAPPAASSRNRRRVWPGAGAGIGFPGCRSRWAPSARMTRKVARGPKVQHQPDAEGRTGPHPRRGSMNIVRPHSPTRSTRKSVGTQSNRRPGRAWAAHRPTSVVIQRQDLQAPPGMPRARCWPAPGIERIRCRRPTPTGRAHPSRQNSKVSINYPIS